MPLTDINKDQEDITRKEKRQARKAGREAKKDVLAGEMVSKEAGRYGVDIQDIPKGPIGDEAKKRITEGIKQTASKEIAEDIEGFSKAYSGPSLETPTVLDEKALKESARRQRKARWVGALEGLGAGLQGKAFDPSTTLSKRLERERGEEFQTFRDISERNKRTQQVWEHGYRKDLIDFIKEKAKDKKLSAAEKMKYDQAVAQLTAKSAQFEKEFGLKEKQFQLKREELEARKAGKYYAPRPTGATARAKFPKTGKLYEMSGSVPAVITELAKISTGYAVDEAGNLDRPLTPEQTEKLSTTLLGRMFKEDENGVLQPIPGMENYIDNIAESIELSNNIESQIETLTNEQLEKTRVKRKREKAEINAEYTSRINELVEKFEDNQIQTRNLLEGNITTPTTQPATTTELDEKLNEFFTK